MDHDRDLGAGWGVALTLSIPDSSLSPILPPPQDRKAKATVVLPTGGPGYTTDVRVLLGRPGCGSLKLEGEALEVGRMLLGDGTKVLVLAGLFTTTDARERQVVEQRANAIREGVGDRPVPRAMAWGKSDDTGVPFFIDLGDPRPPQDRPELIPRYVGPADTIVRPVRGPAGDLDA